MFSLVRKTQERLKTIDLQPTYFRDFAQNRGKARVDSREAACGRFAEATAEKPAFPKIRGYALDHHHSRGAAPCSRDSPQPTSRPPPHILGGRAFTCDMAVTVRPCCCCTATR